jgi:hypothetical protein
MRLEHLTNLLTTPPRVRVPIWNRMDGTFFRVSEPPVHCPISVRRGVGRSERGQPERSLKGLLTKNPWNQTIILRSPALDWRNNGRSNS